MLLKCQMISRIRDGTEYSCDMAGHSRASGWLRKMEEQWTLEGPGDFGASSGHQLPMVILIDVMASSTY